MLSLSINNQRQSYAKKSMTQKCQQKIKQYLFDYPGHEEVKIHQSTFNDRALLIVRLVSFIYLSGIYVWALLQMTSFFQNFQYLTLIGYTSTWLYFLLTLQDYFLNTKKYFDRVISSNMHHYIEILNEWAVCIQVPITVVFWSVLLKILLNSPTVTNEQIALNANLHGGPMLCLLIQFFFSRYSFNIQHIPVIIVFNIIYSIINISYSLEVKPIYPPIDWVSPTSYLISAISVFLTLFVHYIGRLVFRKWKINHKTPQAEISESLLSNELLSHQLITPQPQYFPYTTRRSDSNNKL